MRKTSTLSLCVVLFCALIWIRLSISFLETSFSTCLQWRAQVLNSQMHRGRSLEEGHEAKLPNPLRTRNTFCGTWYLPHSRVHKSNAEQCGNFGDSAITKRQLHIFHCACAKRSYFYFLSKSDVTVVFADPDFLYDAGILAIRP